MTDGFMAFAGDEAALRIIVKQQRKEIDKLKEAIRRLANQDATLSACGGDVTVTMDESPQWIPVGERLPPPEVEVLVFAGEYDSGNHVASRDSDGLWFPGVTHWMPLPEPPADDAEQT